MATRPRATVADLCRVPEHGKAEIVHGELIRMSPTGGRPGRAATKIVMRLGRYEEEQGRGYALADNIGFLVNLPNRRSFSPDAAWYTGTVETDDLGFLQGAPLFAVEVRSEGDYGPKAEQAIAAKRADYFAAGTLVVWDVDLLSEDVVRVYRAANPDVPAIYRRGDLAEAEPAVPGWTMPVEDLYR